MLVRKHALKKSKIEIKFLCFTHSLQDGDKSPTLYPLWASTFSSINRTDDNYQSSCEGKGDCTGNEPSITHDIQILKKEKKKLQVPGCCTLKRFPLYTSLTPLHCLQTQNIPEGNIREIPASFIIQLHPRLFWVPKPLLPGHPALESSSTAVHFSNTKLKGANVSV